MYYRLGDVGSIYDKDAVSRAEEGAGEGRDV